MEKEFEMSAVDHQITPTLPDAEKTLYLADLGLVDGQEDPISLF